MKGERALEDVLTVIEVSELQKIKSPFPSFLHSLFFFQTGISLRSREASCYKEVKDNSSETQVRKKPFQNMEPELL